MNDLKLMIPGPVEVDEDTLFRMGRPVMVHYGDDWVRIYNETVDFLKTVFQTRHDMFILVGSGSAALDAGINGLLGRGDKAILGINGFFGERLKEIILSYGAEVIAVEAEWGRPITAEMVAEAVRNNPDAKAVVIVHNETSTGVVNPIRQIGEVLAECERKAFMVDAVTSIGGIEFAMDQWGIDIAVTASQKCLGAPPGLAMIAVGPKAWKIMESRTVPPVGWYLNLLNWREYRERWCQWHPYPITMATNNVLALNNVLRVLLEKGLTRRIERHRQAARMFRDGISRIGLKLVVGDDYASCTTTAVQTPPNMPSGELVDFLKNEHRILIANGLGVTKGRWVRIGHMGREGTRPEAIRAVLKGIEDFYRRSVGEGSDEED